MRNFIDWFNRTRQVTAGGTAGWCARVLHTSGSSHPRFEDGNGRIGRAILDMASLRMHGSARLHGLSQSSATGNPVYRRAESPSAARTPPPGCSGFLKHSRHRVRVERSSTSPSRPLWNEHKDIADRAATLRSTACSGRTGRFGRHDRAQYAAHKDLRQLRRANSSTSCIKPCSSPG